MIISRFISDLPFVHKINAGPASGLQFEVTLPRDKAVWKGTYEQEFASAIARSITRGDVCYDVGGYRGYITGVMALAGATKVVVFEPLPANIHAIQRLQDLNPQLRIELLAVAVGNVHGSMRFIVLPDPSMGKVVTSSFQPDLASVYEIEVAMRRLDDLVKQGIIPKPNLIKIDVEGAELDVLKGAESILMECHPLIFLEAHSKALEQACWRELQRLGYEVHRSGAEPAREQDARHLIARQHEAC